MPSKCGAVCATRLVSPSEIRYQTWEIKNRNDFSAWRRANCIHLLWFLVEKRRSLPPRHATR